MGGDKVPTPFDKYVELFKAEEVGLVEISWDLEGMHAKKVKVEPHPCDPCTLRVDFDPEDCDGCSKEMEQMTYVPPRLRRRVKAL